MKDDKITYCSVKLIDQNKYSQFQYVKRLFAELAEKSGGGLYDSQESPTLTYCTVFVEVKQAQLVGKQLELFREALSLVDAFFTFPIDENSVLMSASVHNVWLELL